LIAFDPPNISGGKMAFESVKVGETKTEASSQSSPLPRSELTPSEAFIRCVPEEDEVLLRTTKAEEFSNVDSLRSFPVDLMTSFSHSTTASFLSCKVFFY